jgi:hypothetical protein
MKMAASGNSDGVTDLPRLARGYLRGIGVCRDEPIGPRTTTLDYISHELVQKKSRFIYLPLAFTSQDLVSIKRQGTLRPS